MLLRDALHARSTGASTSYSADNSQVSINMPDAFDLDSEVEGLRGQIGRLKQVHTRLSAMRFLTFGWYCATLSQSVRTHVMSNAHASQR